MAGRSPFHGSTHAFLGHQVSPSIYKRPRIRVSHLLCTHTNPKSFFSCVSFLADQFTPHLRVWIDFWLNQNKCFCLLASNLYSLVVCVYKNEVITYFSNYQEIDKQNGKGFIIDLFVQESRLIWSASGTFTIYVLVNIYMLYLILASAIRVFNYSTLTVASRAMYNM